LQKFLKFYYLTFM